jgi:hypothetical protein
VIYVILTNHIQTNTLGTLRMMDLADECKNMGKEEHTNKQHPVSNMLQTFSGFHSYVIRLFRSQLT